MLEQAEAEEVLLQLHGSRASFGLQPRVPAVAWSLLGPTPGVVLAGKVSEYEPT